LIFLNVSGIILTHVKLLLYWCSSVLVHPIVYSYFRYQSSTR